MDNNIKKPASKMLGALVDESLYWEFKKIASSRQEDMQVAICNAALLYINACEQDSEGEKHAG